MAKQIKKIIFTLETSTAHLFWQKAPKEATGIIRVCGQFRPRALCQQRNYLFHHIFVVSALFISAHAFASTSNLRFQRKPAKTLIITTDWELGPNWHIKLENHSIFRDFLCSVSNGSLTGSHNGPMKRSVAWFYRAWDAWTPSHDFCYLWTL